MKSIARYWAALLLGVLLMLPALAHHSAAAFDATRTATLSGTVKRFDWTNPHVWIILVPAHQAAGAPAVRFECAAPGVLIRAGWTEDTLNSGDQLTITYHPRRDGAAGGLFVAATLPGGRQLSARGGGIVPGGVAQ